MASETDVLIWIQGNLSGGIMDPLMEFVSYSGDHGAIWLIIAVALMIYKPTREAGVVMAAAVLMGHVLNDWMIKPLVERPRPFIEDLSLLLIIVPPDGYSFASGHTVKAFAAASALFIYDRRWGAVLMAYAALTGFSRTYLMVHYPSDVVAGAFIGIMCAVTAYAVMEQIKKRKLRPGFEAGE
ncbi:MAG: phosphatase PAP2 family protein [Candidatus Methanomethylophilaceae archaeon]|nr:phosphatase PAP2 family protein [Candidatus Methanomethylophilaceae archaeon]